MITDFASASTKSGFDNKLLRNYHEYKQDANAMIRTSKHSGVHFRKPVADANRCGLTAEWTLECQAEQETFSPQYAGRLFPVTGTLRQMDDFLGCWPSVNKGGTTVSRPFGGWRAFLRFGGSLDVEKKMAGGITK
jgi:hypothetical protein